MDHETDRTPRGRHAVILGGSITGLLTARVLADHFDAVTLVERDRLPDGDQARAGTPQAQHAHVVLARGRHIMERLLPGLDAELAAAGAPAFDPGLAGRTLLSAGWSPAVRSGLLVYACSRSLLESRVRRRVLALPGVRVLHRYDATGLLLDESRASIVAARVRRRTLPHESLAGGETLRADLVVDACGRASRAAEWLELLGYPPAQATVVNSFSGYASRWYERLGAPAGGSPAWSSLVVASRPPHLTRGAAMLATEGGRWSLTLAGHMRDYPPTDEAAFLQFARSLPTPVIYDTIKDARPLSPIYGCRRVENRLMHYDRMARWPERLVVLGDAVCAFNPVYAQGLTVAAMAVLALDARLRAIGAGGDLSGMAHDFQKDLAKLVVDPWTMATGEDARWPGTEWSQPRPSTRFMHWYMDQVLQAVPQRPDIYRVMLQTIHMLAPPSALFKPAIVVQVLRQASSLRSRTQPGALEPLGQSL